MLFIKKCLKFAKSFIMIESCFIRKNSKELQNALSEIGFRICPCCNFNNAVWLHICTSHTPPSLHGLGYWDETVPFNSVEAVLNDFLQNDKDFDCGEDDELFIRKSKEIYNVYIQGKF